MYGVKAIDKYIGANIGNKALNTKQNPFELLIPRK